MLNGLFCKNCKAIILNCHAYFSNEEECTAPVKSTAEATKVSRQYVHKYE